MSVRINHSNASLNVKHTETNRSYLIKYPCGDPSQCSEYSITFNPGTYLLEVWGSQGGDSIGYTGKGGSGGYSIGVFKTNAIKLYIFILALFLQIV